MTLREQLDQLRTDLRPIQRVKSRYWLKKRMHVHVWDIKEGDEPIQEIDVEPFDYQYLNPSYVQFGFEHKGEWLEIRIWT